MARCKTVPFQNPLEAQYGVCQRPRPAATRMHTCSLKYGPKKTRTGGRLPDNTWPFRLGRLPPCVGTHPPLSALPADVSTVRAKDDLPLCPRQAQAMLPSTCLGSPFAKGAGCRNSALGLGTSGFRVGGGLAGLHPGCPGQRLMEP